MSHSHSHPDLHDASGLASQHAQLNRFIEELLGALRLGDRARAAEVLHLFQSALAAHFTVEEEIVFVAMSGLEPHLQAPFETLRHEHSSFLLQVGQLDRAVSVADPADVATMVESLLTDLRTHEDQEESLLRHH